MSRIEKLPKRTPKKKRTGLAIALLVLALILVVGGAVSFIVAIQGPQQQIIDINRTERAAAGQTAMQEFELTQQANR